ncbi:MAG: hypothetical protein ACOH5I_16285 [Oligoflexus sp.]
MADFKHWDQSKAIKIIGIIIVGLGGLSCQWLFRTHAKSYPGTVQPQIGTYASDRLELDDIRDFYKRVFGGPDDDYSTDWVLLDGFRNGSVIEERTPYRDSWYPERDGGTNINGSLTRYDQAFHGGQSTAARWEFENNTRQSPGWYGHCNGTSVAAINFQNPQGSVSRPRGCELDPDVNCVIFTPADIRALLAEINMNAKAKFISGNRCRLTTSELQNNRPGLRMNPLVMDACDDVNPGSFHVGLVNFIGRKKQPLIFDMNRDVEVWNYPIFAYNYTPEGPLTEEEAIQRLGADVDSWIFNPEATSWYHISMTVYYRRAPRGFDGAGTVPAGEQITYTYLLELDENGKVLGGEWTGESQTNHPDFIWMAFEPAEPTGSASRGNPHVSNNEVISIWAESVGLDPDNPFRDKPNNPYDVRFYPTADIDWGEVRGYYRLVLDGRTTGTAFRGKKTHLRVLVSDNLKDNATVDLFLNGKSLGRQKPKDGKIDLIFDALSGINYLNLKWDSERISSSELDWEFRFYAM